MKYIINWVPVSKQGHYLCHLKINNEKNRMLVCSKKIYHLYRRSCLGEVASIIRLQKISMSTQQILGYFEKENKKFHKIVKNKVKERVRPAQCFSELSFSVSNAIGFHFLRLIRCFDQISFQLDICQMSEVLTSAVLHDKKKQYWKPVIDLVMLISQTPSQCRALGTELSPSERRLIVMAMKNKRMPSLSISVVNELIVLLGKEEAG